MEKIKKISARSVIKWVFLVLLGLYVILIIGRIIYRFDESKTAEQVAKIHATKLTMDDVTGDNLPADPGAEADKTVQGVDANKNGIRDDVELAVFKEYPNSTKTRAVLLQYALALQTQMTLPLVNTETVTATAEDRSRALNCIWSISSRSDMDKFTIETDKNENFIESRVLNSDQRKKYRENVYEYLGSYSRSRESCDLDLSTLSN